MPPIRSRPPGRRRPRPLGLEVLEGRVVPAVITVVNTDDAGVGSLRDAIETANLDAAEDTIAFAPEVTGTITLLSALPELSTDVIVSGPGMSALTVARSSAVGTPMFRIFTVTADAAVTLSGLTMTGGQVRGVGMNFISGGGGGVYNAGTLTVTESTLSGNAAGPGGGIYNAGTLTVSASTLSGNAASGSNFSNDWGAGGGIFNSGTLTFTDSTLSGNSASGFFNIIRGGSSDTGDGGGVYNEGTLTVTDSTLSGNAANGRGGGISNRGTLSVANSTLSGNAANGFSRSRVADPSPLGAGGGIANHNSGRATVIASTLVGNSANGSGGGISNRDGGGTLTATTSLFANPAGGNLVSVSSAAFVSGGHNLFSDTPGAALDPTDLTNTDPLIGPLAANGGPTATHALLPGSPAIDAGLAVAGLTTDQRGIPRPQGSAPDIGAFERRAFTVLNTNDSGAGSLREAIGQANLDAALDVIEFAPGVSGAITLRSALPELSTDMTIDGPGSSALTVARDAAPGTPEFRIFTVAAGAEVTIAGLTITGGRATFGGGISNNGTLTVTDSTLSGNRGFGSSDQALGGGIWNAGALTVTVSILSGNGAGSGGGIWNAGALTVTASTLRDNAGRGGGIWNSGALTVTASTLSGNIGGGGPFFNEGGGIYNTGTLTVSASTLSGNAVPFGGGGGRFGLASIPIVGIGGGIWNAGALTVTASTLSGNSGSDGGGIFNRGTLTATTSLFANPIGSNLVNEGSIVFVSGGHNLFSDSPGVALDPTDLTNTDPLIGPLAANGGPTATHALLPGSPAIDAGIAVAGITTDQRGIPRPQGAAPDIGAFESRGFTLSLVGGRGQAAPAGVAFAEPLVVAVTSPFGEPVAGGRVSFGAADGPPSAIREGTSAIDGDGRARFAATAGEVAGTFVVAAGARGAAAVAFPLTVTAAGPGGGGDGPSGGGGGDGPSGGGGGDTGGGDATAPTVVALRRFGYHARPTTLRLTFSSPLDPARAQEVGNYRLHMAGPRRRAVRLRAARYDAATRSVSLEPARRLPLSRTFVLTVEGTPADGLTGASGVPLAGRDGRAGTDFVVTIDRATLVLPTSGPAGHRGRPGMRRP